MPDRQPSELEDLGSDTAIDFGGEDQEIDTLEDAIGALDDQELDVEEEQTEAETGESEGDEPPQDETEEAEDSDDTGDVIVEINGEQLALTEVEQGYLRNRDYTHKTEQLAREREATMADRQAYTNAVQQLQTVHQNLKSYVEGLIPPEPDLSLLQTNPAQYQYQQALRTNVQAELERVMEGQGEVETVSQGVDQGQLQRLKDAEDAKLLAAMPNLKDPVQRTAFDEANKKVALDFGFTEHEIETTADHRILQLVYFARLGKIADNNRRNANKRITSKPQKAKSRPSPVKKSSTSRQAMARLSKSGSIQDAMSIAIEGVD